MSDLTESRAWFPKLLVFIHSLSSQLMLPWRLKSTPLRRCTCCSTSMLYSVRGIYTWQTWKMSVLFCRGISEQTLRKVYRKGSNWMWFHRFRSHLSLDAATIGMFVSLELIDRCSCLYWKWLVNVQLAPSTAYSSCPPLSWTSQNNKHWCWTLMELITWLLGLWQ